MFIITVSNEIGNEVSKDSVSLSFRDAHMDAKTRSAKLGGLSLVTLSDTSGNDLGHYRNGM